MLSIRLKLALFFISILAIQSASANESSQKLILAYQINESFPYQMGNGGSVADLPGIAIEILNAAAEKLDIEVEYRRYPNIRVQLLLRQGEIDGAFMFSYKQNRLENGRYPLLDGLVDTSKRIATLSYSLYVLEDSPTQWDGTKFTNLNSSIAAGAGYSIVDDLRKKGQSVVEVPAPINSFLMLRAGYVGAVAAQGTTADPLIAANGFTGIKKLPTPLVSKEYYLMLSHKLVDKSPDLAARFWQAIADVREQVVNDVAIKYVKN